MSNLPPLMRRYRHVKPDAEASAALAKQVEEDRLIALALQGSGRQEDKLQAIMALPESLRQKARAIFFAKQRTGGFGPAKYVDPAVAGADAKGGAAAVPKGVCFAFRRGECKFGDTCIFRHDDSGADPTNSKTKWKAYRAAKAKDKEEIANPPTDKQGSLSLA